MPGEIAPRAERRRWIGAAFAAPAFLAVLWTFALPGASGALIGSLALLAIGIALAALTITRTPAAERLGGRASAARRTTLALAFAATLLLYAALTLGVLATNAGALWECLAWPLCAPGNDIAIIAIAHRIAAGLATILIVAVVWRIWQSGQALQLRSTAAWALGLILAEHAIGALQIALAQAGATLPTDAARLAHLTVGASAWGALVTLTAFLTRLPYVAPTPAADARGATDRALLSGRPSLLKDYISLTKPGVISLLIFTTITSMYITPAGVPELGLVLWTTLGGWLMAAGSHALNCYFDKDIDINMGRTSRRPIPSGRIPAWHAAVLGAALGVVAFAILAVFVNMAAALLAFAGLFYYVVIYTIWLKRTSMNNIVIGGGAGAFPPLVGWAAVTGTISPAALILWVIIFYWTPPHFWALALIRQKDYARAGVPMLPVVVGDDETKRQILLYSIMMLALSVLPTPFGILGVPYLIAALALGAIFIYYALQLMRSTATSAAWGLYKYSLLYLALLFAAMVADRVAFA
jgi:protoheme IX farnesyltransferase